MSMRGLMSLYAMGYAAALSTLDKPYYMGDYPENPMNDYQPVKMGGFTAAQGKRKKSKKQRKAENLKRIKQLKNKK